MICNNLESVVQSLVQMNLENAISSDRFSSEKGEDSMASKFKERVKIGTNDDGTPIYGWATGGTKEELHKSIAILLGQSASSAPKESKPIPYWEQCAQTWYDVFHLPNISPKTVTKDSSLFRKHVKPAFEGKKISDITTTDVQNYLQTKQHYCKSQVRDIMWMLKGVFSSAFEDDYISRNPMDSDRIFNPSQKEIAERKALSPEEQADIVSNLPKIKNPSGRLYMAFLMFTCLRPCEILGLRWDEYDDEKCIIQVKRDLVFVNGKTTIGATKTEHSKREVPICQELYDHMKPLFGNGYIFGANGNPISSESVYRKMWGDIKNQIDVHGMTPYVGRHTYATNMSRAGIPIKTAMSLMGHKDERMLLRTYTHSSHDDLLAASNTVLHYINGLTVNQAAKSNI